MLSHYHNPAPASYSAAEPAAPLPASTAAIAPDTSPAPNLSSTFDFLQQAPQQPPRPSPPGNHDTAPHTPADDHLFLGFAMDVPSHPPLRPSTTSTPSTAALPASAVQTSSSTSPTASHTPDVFGMLAPTSLPTGNQPPHGIKREHGDALDGQLDSAALAALAPRTSEYRSLSTTQRPSTAPAPVQSDPSGTSVDDNGGELGGPEGDRKTRFVYKLHRMVEDPECQGTISWSPSGNSVIISDVDAFCAGVLGKHFKHNNFSSFIRQLNMYGFYKANKSHRAARASGQPQTWEFSHAAFRRGRTDLLETIRRRTLDTESVRYEATRDLQNDMSISYARLQSQLTNVSDALAASQAENVALWSFVSQLRTTLAQVVDRTNLTNVVPVPMVPAHRATPALNLPVRPDPPIFAHAIPPLAQGAPGTQVQQTQAQHNPALVQLSRPVTAPSMSQHIPNGASILFRPEGSPAQPGQQGLYRTPSMDPEGLFGSQSFTFNSTSRPRPQGSMQLPSQVSQYANIQLSGAPGVEPPLKRRAVESDMPPNFGFNLS